jgi:hypothetical protein
MKGYINGGAGVVHLEGFRDGNGLIESAGGTV